MDNARAAEEVDPEGVSPPPKRLKAEGDGQPGDLQEEDLAHAILGSAPPSPVLPPAKGRAHLHLAHLTHDQLMQLAKESVTGEMQGVYLLKNPPMLLEEPPELTSHKGEGKHKHAAAGETFVRENSSEEILEALEAHIHRNAPAPWEALGCPGGKAPELGGRPLDLARLHHAVGDLGGYVRVTESRQWGKIVARLLGNSGGAAAAGAAGGGGEGGDGEGLDAFLARNLYLKFLWSLERRARLAVDAKKREEQRRMAELEAARRIERAKEAVAAQAEEEAAQAEAAREARKGGRGGGKRGGGGSEEEGAPPPDPLEAERQRGRRGAKSDKWAAAVAKIVGMGFSYDEADEALEKTKWRGVSAEVALQHLLGGD